MRSIWRGALSFGLIHIPIRLYSGSRGRELKFRLLHKKDHGEIRYARICKSDGKEIPWKDVVKGYEYRKGDYIVLADEDFEKANLKRTKSIEILDFTLEEEIDSMYFEKPYYMEPEKGAEKAYVLLREALRRSKKVAIGRFVFMHHEHIGVIKPHGEMLILNQLRYDSELVKPQGLRIPKTSAVSKNELEMALQLIDNLTKPFRPGQYHDTYITEMQAIIRKKAKGKKIALRVTV